MIIQCKITIQCDEPECTKQFIVTEAWKWTPTQAAAEAEKTGWQKRMWMGMEPRMYCPIHAKQPRG